MFAFNALLCCFILMYFSQRTLPLCVSGTPKQCENVEFVPGSNLAGEGFDITTMERKGAFVLNMDEWKHKDQTCTLCSNPYLKNKKQKLPLVVVDWRAKQSCSAKVSSKLHKSSESLVSDSSSSVENNWKVDLKFDAASRSASFMLSGTQSKLAKYSMEKTKNDKFSFTSHSASCEYYSYRVSSKPKLNKEFQNAVKQLPKVYSADVKQSFYRMIDIFGTHYITKVKLGGSIQSTTSIHQCEVSLQGLSVEEVQMCLTAEASVSIGASAKVESNHCKKDIQNSGSKSDFSSMFSDRFTEIRGGHTTEPDLLFSARRDRSAYSEWLTTIPQHPDLNTFSLESLHELLPTNDSTRESLRSAISHYILEKGLWRNCSEQCQTGIKTDRRDSCVCQCHNIPSVNQDCCPTRRGMAEVTITVQQASGLWGDTVTATDGYVKVFFNNRMYRTNVIGNDNNPQWNYVLPLGPQHMSPESKVKFEVWDQDSGWDDDLLGTFEQVLIAGVQEDVQNLNHGRLFYKWEVKCAPSLSGSWCTEYKPTPMSQSLKELYVSRHARPIPKTTLQKMGVFVDDPGNWKNESFIF